MDRRQFVSFLCSVTAVLGGGSTIGLISGCSRGNIEPIDKSVLGEDEERLLTSKLAHLSDSNFDQYARQNSGSDLYKVLLGKGVVSDRGEFLEGEVGSQASIDTVVEYRDFYYTETELELYGLAYTLVMSQATA